MNREKYSDSLESEVVSLLFGIIRSLVWRTTKVVKNNYFPEYFLLFILLVLALSVFKIL